MKFYRYGYGIVDKDGKPWWNESCVSPDRGEIDETVMSVNDNPYNDEELCGRPYRVVALYFRSRK